MAQQVTFEVAPRTVMGKATKRLRRAGIIPGNVYGHKQASVPVQVDAVEFERLRRAHGLRNIIALRMGTSRPQTVLVRHLQHDALSGKILHIDFSRVNLEETIESKIPLHFVGEAPGVKVFGGVLLHLLEALPVECKAEDIVEHIDVDVSSLAEIGDVLHARDVPLPAGYKLTIDPDEPIAKINAPRVEVPGAEEAATAAEQAATETRPEGGAEE